MTTPGNGFDEPDEQDRQLLDELRDLYADIDPMPPQLPADTHFALELEGMRFELARPDPRRELVGTTSRGAPRVQHITFESDELTMIVAVARNADRTRRIEGHLAPPGVCAVEARTAGGSVTTESNEDGRFEVDNIPAGLVQFIVRTAGATVVSSAVTV
jgi:hypothetical protein